MTITSNNLILSNLWQKKKSLTTTTLTRWLMKCLNAIALTSKSFTRTRARVVSTLSKTSSAFMRLKCLGLQKSTAMILTHLLMRKWKLSRPTWATSTLRRLANTSTASLWMFKSRFCSDNQRPQLMITIQISTICSLCTLSLKISTKSRKQCLLINCPLLITSSRELSTSCESKVSHLKQMRILATPKTSLFKNSNWKLTERCASRRKIRSLSFNVKTS